ncbi:MAG: molecular chaperone HtpG [Pseudomonadota bacterium]
MTQEQLSFQAEVSRLLDIVANALYSNKEIFLRELISNASDACDRLRYASITAPELIADGGPFEIRLASDSAAKTLAISDNGIGMDRSDLVENLGTIARSGTAAFMSDLEQKEDGANLIGQFGVGFYSAFMVADRVEVESRKAGEPQGWRWTSDGKGAFSVGECDSAPDRGTKITLHIKKGQEEFLDSTRLKHIVKTYSDHIAIPIKLTAPEKAEGEKEDANGEEESLNVASALWARPKSEITDEQYNEFYHHVGQGFDTPWLRLHFRAEGKIEYTGLLFVPSAKPFDLFHPDRKNHLKLYVRRVFITDDCPELLPHYLRFLRGVIDTEDLPLNISRELLQHNPMLAKIRAAICKRVIGELKKQAKKDVEGYAAFWDNFGAVLKEGIYEDQEQRAALLELARFRVVSGDGQVSDQLTSLADYVARMKEGQDEVYYISGENPEALAKSPQLEGFAARGIEVLILSDPVDDFWLSMVPDYEGKALKSVTRGDADLSKVAKAEGDDSQEEDDQEGGADRDVNGLVAYVKLALKDKVKDVRASDRLTASAVCLVAGEGDLDMHMERILKQHKQLDQSSQRVLEINPKHPMIRSLAAHVGQDGAGESLENMAFLLLDQAKILEGEALEDPTAFAARLSKVMEQGMDKGPK